MSGKLPIFFLVCCLAAAAQHHVLLDFSGSMKGFAIAPNARLTGMLQRLGRGLEASGSLRFHGFNTTGGRNAFSDLSVNDAASRFTNKSGYSGNSPLIWSISQAVQKPQAAEILVFTDGMEDAAKLENVANALAQYARDGWSLGIAALVLPFDGAYYAEMKIPLEEFLPKIIEGVRQADPAWVVSKINCTDADGSTCYGFKGKRPLLVLLLSKTGGLAKLYSALDDAAGQVSLTVNRKLPLFPVSEYTPIVRAELKADTRQALKPPLAFETAKDNVKAEFSCLQSGRDPLPMSLILSSTSNTANDAVIARPHGVRVVGSPPSWVSRTGSNLNIQPDGAARHDLTFVCRSPGVFSSSSVLPGSLKLEYTYKRMARTQGWWIDLSSDNPWQFPHKVYRLRELVNKVQELVLEKQSPRTLQVELFLKSAI